MFKFFFTDGTSVEVNSDDINIANTIRTHFASPIDDIPTVRAEEVYIKMRYMDDNGEEMSYIAPLLSHDITYFLREQPYEDYKYCCIMPWKADAEGHNAWQFVFVNIVSNNLVINIGERYAQEEDN